MKKFSIYGVQLALVAVMSSVVLEYFYTYVYNHGSIKNKVSWVRNYKNKDTLDYVLLGSSRVLYFLDPKLIMEKTNKKGINLGYDACGPFEINLILEEFLKTNTTKKIFLQIDYSYDNDRPDQIGEIAWLPYIKEKPIGDSFSDYGIKYVLFKNVPFFRYQRYESRLGFRYVLLMLAKGDSEFVLNDGYIPNIEKELHFKYKTFNRKYSKKVNSKISQIERICKEKGIALELFTSPIYKYSYNFDFFKQTYSNYNDFSNVINEVSLFSDQTHVNYKGAAVFTDLFIKEYFQK